MLIVLHWTTPEAKQRGIVAMDSCFAISIAVFCLQELIFLAHLLKTNLTKFTAIWLKKGQRVGFLRLISSIIPAPAKEKEKKRRKSEEKRTGGEEKKAMVALLVFIMAIHGYSGPDPNLEIRRGQSSRPFEKSGWGGGRRWSPKNFSALRASVWPKNWSPRPPWIRHCCFGDGFGRKKKLFERSWYLAVKFLKLHLARFKDHII